MVGRTKEWTTAENICRCSYHGRRCLVFSMQELAGCERREADSYDAGHQVLGINDTVVILEGVQVRWLRSVLQRYYKRIDTGAQSSLCATLLLTMSNLNFNHVIFPRSNSRYCQFWSQAGHFPSPLDETVGQLGRNAHI